MQATLGLLLPGSGTFCGSLPSIITESHLPSTASDARQESENSFLRLLGWTEGIRFSASCTPVISFSTDTASQIEPNWKSIATGISEQCNSQAGSLAQRWGPEELYPLSKAGRLYRVQAKG